MLNSLFTNRGPLAGVLSLIEGHHRFLLNNTGNTNDPKLDHYVINNEGVLANNRHYILTSAMEGQPNGDATTEGQSLLIIGYTYAYMAYGDPKYLAAAERYFDSYITYFYDGDPIPSTPQRYICNWIVNGKEPVLANYPIDNTTPTHSGFKGVEFNFVNGRCLITHGAPYYGEYLDKATFAFRGHLAWDAINASVKYVDGAGNIHWSQDGEQYDVDWVVDYLGRKIDWDGNILEEVATEPKGTVQCKNTTINGIYKLNWGNRQPVEFGGRLIARNEVQHNRPLHVPVNHNYLGNAADAEEWFVDACYLLWKVTGKQKYHDAWKCAEYTVLEYADIDSRDMFFRQSTKANTPFTDGISYDWSYPSNLLATYGRNTLGYILLQKTAASQHTMEQQAVWFRMNLDSKIRSTLAGIDVDGDPLEWKVEIDVSTDKNPDTTTSWGCGLPSSFNNTPASYDVPMRSMAQLAKPDGSAFIVADMRAVAPYGGCVANVQFDTNVYDGRSATIVSAFYPDDDAGMAIGAWLIEGDRMPLNQIVYKCDNDFNLRIADDNLWRWWWMLPKTNGAWRVVTLPKANATISGYQPDHGSGEPRPPAPVFTTVDQVSILLDENTPNSTFQYYVINDIPATFNVADSWVMRYRITVSGGAAYTAIIGDCTALDYRHDNLFCTPGVIPFSNIYQPEAEEFDGWHGMPYPGYQYPFIYIHALEDSQGIMLNNMVDFMWESQQWYFDKFKVLGPCASAYIWNRWDNTKYGPADTWTMYHWGDDTAWAGYQPRAFFGAARAWYELIQESKPIPPRLVEFVENWLKYLIDFTNASGGITPTDFPMTTIPVPDPNDFTGHMCGLWLAGACMAKMSGSAVQGTEQFIEQCVDELQRNYIVTGVPLQKMDGSWSPAVRLGTDNGMFFGFWSGEILRALGIYSLYKMGKPA